jgi:hypothetical protein
VRRNKSPNRLQLALDLVPREPAEIVPNVKGLIEALADLLLEAMGETETMPDMAIRRGGDHEPQDHA